MLGYNGFIQETEDAAALALGRNGFIQPVEEQGGAFITGGGVAGQVAFFSGATAIAGNANLTWNSTNNALNVGNSRLFSNGTATVDRNLFLGELAGNFTLTGTENVGIGYLALNSVTGGIDPAGRYNTAIGSFALAVNTSGSKNTAVGRATLDANTIGIENTALGYGCLHSNISGSSNTGVGFENLHDDTDGVGCTGVGYRALKASNANYNTAVGMAASELNTIGTRNTSVGVNACNTNLIGNDNVGIGYGAGITNTGSGNIFVGAGADCSAGLTNVTVIATGLTGTVSNSLYLGNGQTVRFTGQALGPDGSVAIPTYSGTTDPDTGMYFAGVADISFTIAGGRQYAFNASDFYILSNTATIRLGASADVIIARDAAAVLALKNGATAQEFRVYGTTTGPKYARLSHDGSNGAIGTNDGDLLLVTSGSEKWRVTASSGGIVSAGNFRFSHGTSALATNATEGFLFIQSCAGTPTLAPASIPTGQKAVIYDSTNDILYVYNGAWKGVALA